MRRNENTSSNCSGEEVIRRLRVDQLDADAHLSVRSPAHAAPDDVARVELDAPRLRTSASWPRVAKVELWVITGKLRAPRQGGDQIVGQAVGEMRFHRIGAVAAQRQDGDGREISGGRGRRGRVVRRRAARIVRRAVIGIDLEDGGSTGRAMFFSAIVPAGVAFAECVPARWSWTAREMQIAPGGQAVSSRTATITPSPCQIRSVGDGVRPSGCRPGKRIGSSQSSLPSCAATRRWIAQAQRARLRGCSNTTRQGGSPAVWMMLPPWRRTRGSISAVRQRPDPRVSVPASLGAADQLRSVADDIEMRDRGQGAHALPRTGRFVVV